LFNPECFQDTSATEVQTPIGESKQLHPLEFDTVALQLQSRNDSDANLGLYRYKMTQIALNAPQFRPNVTLFYNYSGTG